MHENTRAFVAAHLREGASLPEPLKIRRPAVGDRRQTGPAEERVAAEEPTKKRLATAEEMRAFFAAGGAAIRYTGPPIAS